MSFFDTEPIEFTIEMSEESQKEWDKLTEFPDKVRDSMLLIYNYMATHQTSQLALGFDSGIKILCSIDATLWKDKDFVSFMEERGLG